MSRGIIRRVLLVALVVVLIILLGRFTAVRLPSAQSKLSLKLEKIVRVDTEPPLSCADIVVRRPIVILAMGQSNAANHGARAADTDVPVTLFADGKCVMAVDPLPGGTGSGGSIWYRLPRHFASLAKQERRPIVLSVLAVEATTIGEWTADTSPLHERLTRQLKSMQAQGLAPQLVLWQQGEADALNANASADVGGTTEHAYTEGLDKLAGIFDGAGVHAPIVVALSTVCRSEPNMAIRHAIESKVANDPRFKLGPDTDYDIHAGLRSNKCHFSAEGLNRAAQLWAAAIVPLAVRP